MLIKVLGSGAGGGLPQWNCNCANCTRTRAWTNGFKPRTQSSIAVSENGEDWVLINASPDLLTQLRAHPDLGTRAKISDSSAKEQAGAGLDHFVGENLPPDHPLCAMDNVVLTPHIGGATWDTEVNHSRSIAEGLRILLEGGRPPNLVNPEVLR